MATSLRFWLISSFSIILLICLIGIGLFIAAFNKAKKLQDYHSDLKTTRILLLETNKLKEDILLGDFNTTAFYTKQFSTPEKQFQTLNKRTNYYITHFEKSQITKNNKLEWKIAHIKNQLIRYNKIYNELIYLYKLKGFKDFGLEGKMRAYAHDVYDYSNKEVKFFCLLLRKHEKDFLLRKDNNYVLQYNKEIKNCIEFITRSSKINQKDKNYLFDKLYYYNKYFKLLARIEEKIGVTGGEGYLNKSKETFDNIALRIEDMDNELKLIEAEHKEKLKKDTLIVVFILISFLISTIIILTQLITKSVKTISDSFSNYVNSSFSSEAVFYKKSKIKEFNDIYISFLKMVKEINIFTNFFKEKVNERTLAINQQKNEILAQQLQIENQYKSLLETNSELNAQKYLLAIKNEDIHQSLRYAKRIQKAIQPSSTKFKESLKDSFVFSQAKDVVSGDFHLLYKATKAQNFKEDKIVFIASDCTGHGVPGAIMSVLGINILHKLIKELKNSDPGKILNLLDKDINQILAHDKKGSNIVADGMDIAVFSFDKETYLLEYSIAKFSHFLIREGDVLPLVTQKSTIGYSFFEYNTKNFETSSIQLLPGDCLYVFSDGLQDQFGGPLNKKYKKNNIKELIQKIHLEPMHEQKRIFKREFKTWKGAQTQTDDVSVIGIRF